MEVRKESSEVVRTAVLDLLVRHNVPLEQWGTDRFKTVDHLVREVENGESHLTVSVEGEIIRGIRVASIDVLYKTDEAVLRLVEDRQEFADGRVRRRSMPGSVSEKMLATEDPILAARRALHEELGLTGPTSPVLLGQDHDFSPSQSYPGLFSARDLFRLQAEIDASQFNPEGYVEQQSDKSTYFVWKPVE